MAESATDFGYRLWRDEVESLARPEKDVPYIPIIALAGIYIAHTPDIDSLNSYSWRRSVLSSQDALSGIRESLTSFHRDEIDIDFEIPIHYIKPEEGAALQHVCAYASLIDGLPEGVTTVAGNELFLAQTLGFAEHDYGVTFYPLRMAAGGLQALRNNYPITEAYVTECL